MRKSFTLLGFLIGSLCFGYGQDHNQDEEHLFYEIEDYLYSPNQERKKSREYFKKVKSLADSGNAEAYYYLGMLQKDGMGTKQSFKKSLRSFKHSYEHGNTKAAYCVGYYFLKGFGEVQQDYTKAYRWFKKSETSMGRHWMAKMNFLGLGREANKQKALKILSENDVYNSKVLISQYEDLEPPNGSTENFNEYLSSNKIGDLYDLSGLNNIPTKAFMNGTWEGEYLELDWSNSKIFRTLPISIEFNGDGVTDESIQIQMKVADSMAHDLGHYSAGKLSFPDLSLAVAKQFTDYPNFTHLMTDIGNLELRNTLFKGENLIIARVNAHYPVWKERANPILLILKKKIEISEEVKVAFEQQGSDFIRIFPNPVPNQCLVNFELTQNSEVKVELTNYYNTPSYYKELYGRNMGKGEHTIELYDLPHNQGTYLLTLTHNGQKETKIIIKE